jgi:hypothetical protein
VKQGGAYGWLAIGQLMFSCVTIGQGGVGLFGFVGQVGVGAQAIGQGVWRRRSAEHFQELSRDLDDALAFPFARRTIEDDGPRRGLRSGASNRQNR